MYRNFLLDVHKFQKNIDKNVHVILNWHTKAILVVLGVIVDICGMERSDGAMKILAQDPVPTNWHAKQANGTALRTTGDALRAMGHKNSISQCYQSSKVFW